MVYRQHAEELAPVAPDDPNRALVTYSADGANGARGVDGAPGADGSGSGVSGGDGDHAGAAERGHDGGTVMVRLAPSGDSALSVSGERKRAGYKQKEIHDEIALGDSGYVDLVARGGHGGHGGHGGGGGDGARGYRGSDATRFSSGTDGGRGGNGGDGGWATSGADGGSGGAIVVTLADEHAYLAMLVRQAVNGGSGGQPGQNGAGGSGGPGGSGGSSYSWTTTSSSTDSQGRTRTETHHHRNSGGSDGPSGHAGQSGRAHVTRGDDGAEGAFSIVVETPQGAKSYPSCFAVALAGFSHDSENEDGIYEPGERVKVGLVRVDNRGGMPTPRHQDIEVALVQLGWVLPEEGKLILPRSIEPGTGHVFESEQLWFEVGDYRPMAPSDPLACPETIHLAATLPAARRGFGSFENALPDQVGRFLIRFPIEASPLLGLRALAPGEAVTLRWSLTNRSKIAFGAGSECRRRVRFRLAAHESELGDAEVALLDGDGKRVPLASGYERELERIEPGQTLEFSATVGILAGAPHYKSVRLWLTVELGQIRDPEALRPIQLREIDVRVAQRFTADPDADVLLVVNHLTTRESLDAWRGVADEMGLTLNTYDLSLEKGIDLEAGGEGGSLIEQLAGATLLVLNPSVSTPAGDMSAHVLLDKRQLVAAAQAGVSVGFIGRAVSVNRLVAPTIVNQLAEHPDAGALVRAMESGSGEADELAAVHGRLAAYGWRLFGGSPPEAWLEGQARDLAQALARRFPHRRFVVIHEHAPDVASTFLWMKRWRLGTLEVRAMHAQSGSVVRASVDDAALCNPVFVRSPTNIMTLLLTRSFDENLERFGALLAGEGKSERRDALLGLLVEALLVDLANEQLALLETRWRHGMSKSRMLESLPCLRKLAAFEPPPNLHLDPSSPAAAPVTRLVARLRYWAWTKWRFWEWPFYLLRRAPRAHLVTRSLTQRFLENMISAGKDEAVVRGDLATAKRCLAVETQEIRTAYRNHCASWNLARDSPEAHETFAQALLRGALEQKGLTTDAEVLDLWPLRVMSRSDMKALEAEDANYARRRRAAMKAWESTAADLLRAETTEELLRRAT